MPPKTLPLKSFVGSSSVIKKKTALHATNLMLELSLTTFPLKFYHKIIIFKSWDFRFYINWNRISISKLWVMPRVSVFNKKKKGVYRNWFFYMIFILEFARYYHLLEMYANNIKKVIFFYLITLIMSLYIYIYFFYITLSNEKAYEYIHFFEGHLSKLSTGSLATVEESRFHSLRQLTFLYLYKQCRSSSQ